MNPLAPGCRLSIEPQCEAPRCSDFELYRLNSCGLVAGDWGQLVPSSLLVSHFVAFPL